jgi:hypothetical protein
MSSSKADKASTVPFEDLLALLSCLLYMTILRSVLLITEKAVGLTVASKQCGCGRLLLGKASLRRKWIVHVSYPLPSFNFLQKFFQNNIQLPIIVTNFSSDDQAKLCWQLVHNNSGQQTTVRFSWDSKGL